MGINGVGAGCPKWWEMTKAGKNSPGTGFADRIDDMAAAESISSHRSGVRAAGQSSVLETYRASAAAGARNVKPVYDTYESENYRIVPDNEAGCFDIFNKQGERLGAFDYSDIRIRQDSATGKQFLISEHGTMSYDAVIMDDELKKDLRTVLGVETLETEKLEGFTLKTHSGTGIQYLLRDGEEGRGGKIFLQSQADVEKYEALAETYCRKYPNLVRDKNAGYFWASNEIRGLAVQSGRGILSVHYDGMSYNHNSDYRKNWCVKFSGDTYSRIFEWIRNNRESLEEMQEFSLWQEVFRDMNRSYERIEPQYLQDDETL